MPENLADLFDAGRIVQRGQVARITPFGNGLDRAAQQLAGAPGERLAVVADWQKAGRINGDEAESARRHVNQLERVRLEQGALQERALRQEAASGRIGDSIRWGRLAITGPRRSQRVYWRAESVLPTPGGP